MTTILVNITEIDFINGTPLNEAVFTYGTPELIQAFNNAWPKGANKSKTPENGFSGMLAIISQGITELQQGSQNQEKAYIGLKSHILNLIKKGDLIPFGFKMPRNLSDHPIKIPADLFFSGEINWQNSELKFKDLEFAGIRLFENNLPAIEAIPLPQEKAQIAISKKPAISDLDPNLHIDEKQAAEYLGISPRTLQKYRSQGGGPVFIKIGKKNVRYKIADLILWSDMNKRENTAQY